MLVCGDEAWLYEFNVVVPCEGLTLRVAVVTNHQQILWDRAMLLVQQTGLKQTMESQFFGKGTLLRSRLSTSSDLKESQTKNSRPLLPNNDWKQRVKHKTTCTVFHKRGQSGASKATTPSMASTLEELPLGELKERLGHRDRYLQELIEKIVINQEQHSREIDMIEHEYEAQISELHQMLQAAIEKNRVLESQLQDNFGRSPRMSTESLLLGDFQ